MLTYLLRLAVFGTGAYVSCQYADGYWIVGPVFGGVVVLWDSGFLRSFDPAKHLIYLLASTLIYALVFHISSQRWAGGSDLAESLYGPLPVAIVVGSALLPFAHKFFLKAADKIVAQTIPILIFSYYAVAAVSLANDKWSLGLHANFVHVMIVVWQAAYLFFFFPEKKK